MATIINMCWILFSNNKSIKTPLSALKSKSIKTPLSALKCSGVKWCDFHVYFIAAVITVVVPSMSFVFLVVVCLTFLAIFVIKRESQKEKMDFFRSFTDGTSEQVHSYEVPLGFRNSCQ
jgi:hypothetical protein